MENKKKIDFKSQNVIDKLSWLINFFKRQNQSYIISFDDKEDIIIKSK